MNITLLDPRANRPSYFAVDNLTNEGVKELIDSQSLDYVRIPTEQILAFAMDGKQRKLPLNQEATKLLQLLGGVDRVYGKAIVYVDE